MAAAGRAAAGGSAADRIIELLPGQPIISVATAHESIGGSGESVRLALNALEKERVIQQITSGRYARAWAADELFDILNEYEHALATPTRSDQQRRRSPRLQRAPGEAGR